MWLRFNSSSLPWRMPMVAFLTYLSFLYDRVRKGDCSLQVPVIRARRSSKFQPARINICYDMYYWARPTAGLRPTYAVLKTWILVLIQWNSQQGNKHSVQKWKGVLVLSNSALYKVRPKSFKTTVVKHRLLLIWTWFIFILQNTFLLDQYICLQVPSTSSCPPGKQFLKCC